jgi:hypothetical protein
MDQGVQPFRLTRPVDEDWVAIVSTSYLRHSQGRLSPLPFVKKRALIRFGNTLLLSSSVPSACPSECETVRNSAVQRERTAA